MTIGAEGWENLLSDGYLLDRNGNNVGHPFNFRGGAEDYFLNLRHEKDFLRAYNECSPLKALVGKRAKAFNTGKLILLNESSEKKAQGAEAKALQALLDKPNVLQTKQQFRAQQNIYIDIFGYCPILKMRPVGMADVTSIWNLPPWLFDLKYTGAWLNQTTLKGIYSNYYIFWGGEKIEIKFEDVFFIHDDGIGTEHDSNLTIPDSRLVGLEYPISNIIGAYKSRNTLIMKKGAIGILSNTGKDTAGVIPLDPDEKASLQKDFSRYGLVGQPYQVIITDAALQWQQMGFPTKDLMLFEEIQDDIERMCDAYGWPVELMARGKDVTFDNKKQALKSAYRDSIIPESVSRVEQLTAGLTDPLSNLIISVDYSEVEVLQEDKKIMADARGALDSALEKEYKNGLITKNQWLKKLGEEPVTTDPSFDQYYTAPAPIIPDPNADPNLNK